MENPQGSPLLQLSSAGLADLPPDPAFVTTTWDKEEEKQHLLLHLGSARGGVLSWKGRCHEGDSKAGITAGSTGITFRLLPGPPSSLLCLGFCSEGPRKKADGPSTRQRLLLEGWIRAARLSAGLPVQSHLWSRLCGPGLLPQQPIPGTSDWFPGALDSFHKIRQRPAALRHPLPGNRHRLEVRGLP